MHEVLTAQQPYSDVELGTKELLDLIGHLVPPQRGGQARQQELVGRTQVDLLVIILAKLGLADFFWLFVHLSFHYSFRYRC